MAARTQSELAPWPYYTQRTAAKKLGVPVEFLKGMVGQKRSGEFTLRAISTTTTRGNEYTLYCKEDIDTLARRIANR